MVQLLDWCLERRKSWSESSFCGLIIPESVLEEVLLVDRVVPETGSVSHKTGSVSYKTGSVSYKTGSVLMLVGVVVGSSRM